MAEGDTTTQPPEDLIAQAQRIAEIIQGRQQAYTPPAPVDRSTASLLGEAVGGGTTGLSSAEREDAGRRALLNFGANLSAASGYSTMPRSFGQVFAQGVGGAQQSLAGSEAVGAARLGAQQAYEEKQQELQLERIKAALPLLQIEQTERARRGLLGGATPPPGTSIAAAGSYEGDIGTLEGTGKSATSTAAGVGQFIKPTWADFVAANPDLFKGMSPEQILAARDKPEIANKAITWLAQQNAPALAKAGVAPSGPSLALAHRLGPAAAAAVMQAPDNAAVADVLVASIGKDKAAEYIKANSDLGTATAGDLKKKYAGVHAPGFLTPPAADATPVAPAPAPAPTATAPPAATLAPVQVAGPGAPTGTTSMATDAPAAPAAPATPAQQPAVARVPDTFVPARVPLPADIQRRIDHPETPEMEDAYRKAVRSAPDSTRLSALPGERAIAIEKARAAAVAEGEAFQTKAAEQQMEGWKILRAEQAAKDAAATKVETDAKAATLANRTTQINKLRDTAITEDTAQLKTMRTNADDAEGTIKQLQILRSIEKRMPEQGSAWFRDHPDQLDTLVTRFGMSREALLGADARSEFQKVLRSMALAMSQKASVGAGSARGVEIQNNIAALPDLATDHMGRVRLMGFIHNMAQDTLNRANEAEDYYYSHDHPSKELELHQSLFKFPRYYDEKHPSIIPRAPFGATKGWLRDNVKPGMVFEMPVQKTDPLMGPQFDSKGKPIIDHYQLVPREDDE